MTTNIQAQPQTIMLVDDEASITSIFQRILLRAKFSPSVSNCPLEALSEFQEHYANIELVILDYNMPEMDGISLSKAMLALKPTQKIIMISGVADFNLETEIKGIGLQKLMTKPIRAKELIAAVNEIRQLNSLEHT